MSSPGNGYPQRGLPGMFSTPRNSPMFSHAQSPGFTPHGMYSSPVRYSSNNSSQYYFPTVNSLSGRYSPNNSSQYNFPSVNSSQDGYSPRNQFKAGYSPRNSSQQTSFRGNTSTRSASPLHQQALRQSYNKSRDSSSASSSSSYNNSADYNQRFKPYVQNQRNKQNRNSWSSNRSYKIEDYVLPSMVEDPWARLKVDKSKKPEK